MKIHEYKGWRISSIGGFCTIKRFVATKGEQEFWRFRLKEAKADIDLAEQSGSLEHVEPLYLKPLYV